MASDASPLTLSYKSFQQLWKALVSKRKARKLNVDRDLVWHQLVQGGGNPEFLRALDPPKEVKRDQGRETQAENVEQNAPLESPNARTAPKRETLASKTSTAAPTKGKRAASRKIEAKRGVQKRPGTVAVTTRRKRVVGKK